MSIRIVTATPEIDLAIYAAGDAVGGLLEFEDARTVYAPGGFIIKALLKDNDSEDALMYLALFDRTFSPTADQAPFSVSDADLVNLVAILRFEAADYVTLASNSVAQLGLEAAEIYVPFILVDGGTSLFGQLFLGAGMTPTYTAADDLRVELVIGD